MDAKEWRTKCFYRVSIKAVIHDQQGKILVVREKNNPNWNLPGGGMDYGESEYKALQRELLEEINYTGDFAYTPLGIRPMYLEAFESWQLWVVYKVTPENFNFSPGEDANEIAFMDIKEFKESRPHVYAFARLGL
jgi:8-oxo-dGTP pyrophosphatase MutT (NUDIX family)